jgi:hypothetical protein
MIKLLMKIISENRNTGCYRGWSDGGAPEDGRWYGWLRELRRDAVVHWDLCMRTERW